LNNLFCTSEIAGNTVQGLAAEGNSDRYIKNRSEKNIKYAIKPIKRVALKNFSVLIINLSFSINFLLKAQ